MAHETRVDNTGYEISDGKVRVDGTGYEIEDGRTRAEGTGYDISFGVEISTLPVGSSVYMNVNGARTEFLVVNQGNPDSSRYDDSCNGIWLLMKDVYEGRAWGSTDQNYSTSAVHNYLNETFLSLLDADVQSLVSEVKLPFSAGASAAYGSSGVSTKIFLLSGWEIGWDADDLPNTVIDGVCLGYFKGIADYDRVAYYDGSAVTWFTRTCNPRVSGAMWMCTHDGRSASQPAGGKSGIRPALILPSAAKVSTNGDLLA